MGEREMWKRENIIDILNQALQIDPACEMFGASCHRYRLNPPIQASFVRRVEERYHFTLPEDYFRFITEVGDGGAGPDYGIYPFADFLKKGVDAHAERYWEEYRNSLAVPFVPRNMMADEVEEYAIASRETFDRNPDRYYIYEKPEPYDLCDTDGFYILGTRGCQWDFGMVISGDRRGQVFDMDNEGAYCLVSESFEEFYRNWLAYLSDTERYKKDLEKWKKAVSRQKNRKFTN